MNYIWVFLILVSIITGIFTGKLDAVVFSMLDSAKKAVEICLGLIGVMAFWLGIMKIAQASGIVEKFAKFISPVMKKVFNELKDDSPAISDIALNFSANALGLSNAATPFGIKAMEDLQNENKGDKNTATNSMCILLAMNTAGFQLIPSGVLAVLVAQGSVNPTEIVLPALIVTSITFVLAIIIAKMLERVYR